jgi:hypothetical protein
MSLRINMERYYTKEELQYYMQNPNEVELLAYKHDLDIQWEHWLDETIEMTLEEIVEDFFIHFNLIDIHSN